VYTAIQLVSILVALVIARVLISRRTRNAPVR
jgi:hypothetical protein